MKTAYKLFLAAVIVLCSALFFSFRSGNGNSSYIFPYGKAGLNERQAAAHLLSRFTYGAKPGQVDEVVRLGLENWFDQQLNSKLPDVDLDQRLANYEALKMSNSEIVETYLRPAQVLRMAIKDGAINKDSVSKTDKAAYKKVLEAYMQQKGMKPQAELFRQLANQKILRAAYSNNQLREVLTDFWFNHFNVSITKKDCAEFIPGFERDVIRPNVLGTFNNLLLATAKSPAMLFYLDNFSSSSDGGNNMMGNGIFKRNIRNNVQKSLTDSAKVQVLEKLKNRKNAQGLNENYAREVMELHTLGVDGGYTQNDVTQAARVLTGWTIYPFGSYRMGNVIRNFIDKIGEDKLAERGFVHEGDFLFAANRHAPGEKVVLGKTFKSMGYQEGVELLNMLAHHPSTAKFICKKLAVRFVNDEPPAALVAKMAKTFTDKDGDIRQVLLIMVSSPEFWSKDAVREKTKSPFELAVSSVRSLDADIKMPYQLYKWIDKMGQKLYYYQAPTGFPDKGQYWINTGALLNRMNFGLAIASEKIPGVEINLLQLNEGHEPESAEDALIKFGKIIMPERELQQTINRLRPLLHDPQLQQKIENKASGQNLPVSRNGLQEDDQMNMNDGTKELPAKRLASKETKKGSAEMLSQVVGIIIGSPEFQRR